VDRSDASALADLQMHWDEAYAIGLDGDIWSARFHGSADELRAHTSTELRELIRADYGYRQQVRRVQAAAARAEEASDTLDDNDSSRDGIPDPDDDDLDEDYATHFDGEQTDRAGTDDHQDDTEPGAGPGLSPASLPRGYANLRGERMST
jgi:hypothetical protein